MIAVKFLRTWFFLLPLAGQDFNYDNPNQWALKWPQCAGNRQSPVAIHISKAVRDNLPLLSFHYYNDPITSPVEVTNNGHTVNIAIQNTISGNRPSISGGGLDGVYEVQGFHFHWGSPKSRGSEHTINNRQFDLELHIVHKNMKFETVEEASNDPFGLVVLGILFKGVQYKRINATGLNAIYDALPYLSQFDSKHTLNQTITMQSIVGDLYTKQFYKYQGSLTTPPCSEAVTWFVFPDILPIQNKYLKRFWTLFDSRGVRLLNNFRPVQPLKYRKIFYRKRGFF